MKKKQSGFPKVKTSSFRMRHEKYNHQSIEKKWQEKWEKERLYELDNNPAEKFYNLWMFPYPSAEGLHAGHAFASTGSDVYGRFMRMNGKSVFQPIGYDSFGIHSENFAIKINEHPSEVVKRTTANYEKQMRSLGHGYDWTRTVTTSDIDYYRWTQWIFVQMFVSGLAYRKTASVNWCPSCKTVLADEQVMTPKQAEKEPKNEKGEIIQGENLQVCERCGTVVVKKELKQWFFRITDYADRLLDNLDKIDWSDRVVTAQRNWIGRKEGINIKYPIYKSKLSIECFTTRPDTNFGATFVVLAPDHPLAKKIATKENKQKVSDYIKESLRKTKEERIEEGREKTGVFTGSYAINNLNGYKMPIWITDFVLSDFGTGAVVGVPGHDMRDFEFARKYDLEIRRVVVDAKGDKSDITKKEQVQEDEGTMVNSEFLNGLEIMDAKKAIMDYLEKKGWGNKTKQYHLRDWLISRQRYWGPPIPMIYCENCASEGKGYLNQLLNSQVSDIGQSDARINKTEKTGELKTGNREQNTDNLNLLHKDQSDWDHVGWYPVNEKDLPVSLPDIDDYKPQGTGRGPLEDHPDFYEVKCPVCGSEAKRETDVMDTFVDSAWYFLRYPSVGLSEIRHQVSDIRNPKSDNLGVLPWDPEITKSWLPVDLYFGGAEHSVLHLMYARFVTMMLYDLGTVDFEEPFPRFFAHGLMIKDGAKMSKSRGNVVNPDLYIEKFGADTLRLYTMFMGPMDGYPDFRDTGIEGMRRFVEKVWKLFQIKDVKWQTSNELQVKLHKTIKKVTEDLEKFKYNTAIAAIMELVNVISSQFPNSDIQIPNENKDTTLSTQNNMENLSAGRRDGKWKMENSLEILCQLLAPFAPHLAEEAWVSSLGRGFSVHTSTWPSYDEKLTKDEVVSIAVQVNGKLRGTVILERNKANEKDSVVMKAKEDPNVSKWLAGAKTKKEIFVPGRLINFVV